MRLFVAAHPPAAALDDLASRVDDLHIGRAAARGVNSRIAGRPLWHVTLAFLGDVPDDRGNAASDALSAAVHDFHQSPPILRLAGAGTFGRGRFTTLWIGLAGDVAALEALAGTVTTRLRRARLPYDRKPFRPHLTLARPGRLPRSEIAADVEVLAGYAGPMWALDAISLVESHLGPKPSHEIVRRTPLPLG